MGKIARFTYETNGGKAIFGERKREVYAEMHKGGSNRDDGTCFGGMWNNGERKIKIEYTLSEKEEGERGDNRTKTSETIIIDLGYLN